MQIEMEKKKKGWGSNTYIRLSDKIHFKTKAILRDKEGHFIYNSQKMKTT